MKKIPFYFEEIGNKVLVSKDNELFYLQKIGLLTNNTSVLNACSIIAINLEKYDLALFYLNKILDKMHHKLH